MKKLLASLLLVAIFSISSAFAQFQGIIEFEKIKTETTKYSYSVKGNKVRIDETGADGSIKGVMIVNLDKETVIALSPERKLYMDATNKRIAPVIKPTITKTENKKTINGFECTEWIVKYAQENTQISYWVSSETGFDFFIKLIAILNRKDRLSKYFITIPEYETVFPVNAVEKNMDGTIKTELKITKIDKKELPDSLFEIPKDYQKFER
ncbi:MAG: DUF4412 domain-containing protein [Flavobacteriales bacterium]|nr:DUF4412 domain-containing protein [Flavobacteriales bacterium]